MKNLFWFLVTVGELLTLHHKNTIFFFCLNFHAVDGGWGAWGSWTSCSKTCGGAMITRERNCDNPAPENGGKPCDPKDAKETKNDCNQPCESKCT